MKQVMQNAYYWLKNDVLVALLHVLRLYSMIRPQLESKIQILPSNDSTYLFGKQWN